MSELEQIKRIGATPQKNSGRGKFQKGDAVLGPFLIDVKEYKSSFGVSESNWAKLQTDAIGHRLYPAFYLALGEEGKPRTRVFVVGESMFLEMLEAWEEKNANLQE